MEPVLIDSKLIDCPKCQNKIYYGLVHNIDYMNRNKISKFQCTDCLSTLIMKFNIHGNNVEMNISLDHINEPIATELVST